MTPSISHPLIIPCSDHHSMCIYLAQSDSVGTREESMRILTLGASGATGRLVVRAALARGWDVTAVVRDPSVYEERHSSLTIRQADVLDPNSLVGIADDVDAVVSALGIGGSRAATTVYSQGMANVMQTMTDSSCQRIVAVSAVPAGPWMATSWMQRHTVLPILQRMFGGTYDDMRIMERSLVESSFDWTVVRPPRLTNKPATGAYRTSLVGPVPHGGTITRADLAAALVDAIDTLATSRQAVWVAT